MSLFKWSSFCNYVHSPFTVHWNPSLINIVCFHVKLGVNEREESEADLDEDVEEDEHDEDDEDDEEDEDDKEDVEEPQVNILFL